MNYYETNFAMKQHWDWNLHEFEELIPFERDFYVGMLRKHITKLKEDARIAKQGGTRV